MVAIRLVTNPRSRLAATGSAPRSSAERLRARLEQLEQRVEAALDVGERLGGLSHVSQGPADATLIRQHDGESCSAVCCRRKLLRDDHGVDNLTVLRSVQDRPATCTEQSSERALEEGRLDRDQNDRADHRTQLVVAVGSRHVPIMPALARAAADFPSGGRFA